MARATQTVLLLGDGAEATRGDAIPSTRARAMLRAHLRLIEAAQHHVGVVPELRRRVHSLLNIRILAAELLDLFLDSILHKMLPSLARAHDWSLAAN